MAVDGFSHRQSSQSIGYRGRFAPSSTGPLHFGSLVAAVGSYLQARSQQGEWLVRIEDIDPPREVPGAVDDQLRTLELFGLHWDGEVLRQSTRSDAYFSALQQLQQKGLIYPCTCSRKNIVAVAGRTSNPTIYPGTCRNNQAKLQHEPQIPHALRILSTGQIQFVDAVQGLTRQDLQQQVGDFVLRRVDGLYAYQLAVAVDDGEQRITEVVRGSDLLESSIRQIYLQRLLGLPTPRYVHLPVVTNTAGQKLSKQAGAMPLEKHSPGTVLWQALAFLGQQPAEELYGAQCVELWSWAITHWDLTAVPKTRGLAFPDLGKRQL